MLLDASLLRSDQRRKSSRNAAPHESPARDPRGGVRASLPRYRKRRDCRVLGGALVSSVRLVSHPKAGTSSCPLLLLGEALTILPADIRAGPACASFLGALSASLHSGLQKSCKLRQGSTLSTCRYTREPCIQRQSSPISTAYEEWGHPESSETPGDH